MIENFTKVVCVIRPIRLDCVPGGGGFARKLFQRFYSEFDLEMDHDSKYVTWMFLTKHFRSNIQGA